MNDQIVIDELKKLYKKLHDRRRALPPGVSHSRKREDKELKKKWDDLTKQIYCLGRVLSIYNIQTWEVFHQEEKEEVEL